MLATDLMQTQWETHKRPANQYPHKHNLSPHCSLLYTDYNRGQILHKAIREEIGDELSCYSGIDLIVWAHTTALIWFTHILKVCVSRLKSRLTFIFLPYIHAFLVLTAAHGAAGRRFYFGFAVVAVRPLYVTVAANKSPSKHDFIGTQYQPSRRQRAADRLMSEKKWSNTFLCVEKTSINGLMVTTPAARSTLKQPPGVKKNKLKLNIIHVRHLSYL